MNELLSYYQNRRLYGTRDYLYDLIAFNIAPVLNASKPAALITLTNIIKSDLTDTWKREKLVLNQSKKIEHCEIIFRNNRLTIMFYDRKVLQSIFNTESSRDFLKSLDPRYGVDLDNNLKILKSRFKHSAIPHEVGIFLGIPLEDVRSFMNNPQGPVLFTGYWKVYHAPQKAHAIFERYNKAKSELLELIRSGVSAREYLLRVLDNFK